MHENNLVNWNAPGRAGPPFSVRPEKEAKGAVFARHFGSRKIETR